MNNSEISILALDDDPVTNELTSVFLKKNGYQVTTTTSPSNGLEMLKKNYYHLVITDMKMPEISGLDILRHIKENYKDMEVVVLTAHGTIENAVQAVKQGALDYIIKPFTEEDLLKVIQNACQKIMLRLKSGEKSCKSFFGIIGMSGVMQKVYDVIKKVAKTNATVLVTGESGTGKELVARAIHYSSINAKNHFIPVNCGGIPETLLESELFGYAKGAFTGASENRAGFFHAAHGGTIFLDEISETSPAMQVKLLRVIQDKQFYMVGSRVPQEVNVRIITATNKNLKHLVEKGQFREDLYYRLNVVAVELPPLREREDDIVMLIDYFLKKYTGEFNKPMLSLSGKSLSALKNYAWPGNIRELENIIQRLVVMADKQIIDIQDLPHYMRFSAGDYFKPNKALSEVEAEYILRVLNAEGGNKTRAAKILGIERKTLWEKLKKINPALIKDR
jgi:two-component system response regulator HydG